MKKINEIEILQLKKALGLIDYENISDVVQNKETPTVNFTDSEIDVYLKLKSAHALKTIKKLLWFIAAVSMASFIILMLYLVLT